MNRFALAYREQQQLFLFDKTYLLGTLLKVGGLSTLTGRFIVQFFWNPTVALCLTVLLLLLGGWMLWESVRRSLSDWVLLPVVLIPFVLLGGSLADNAVYFDVVPAWLFAVAAFRLYNHSSRARVWKGLILTVVLYLAAGPGALLFAVSAMVTDAFRRDWRGVLYPVLGLLCGWLAYRLAWVPTLSAAWTPALFYNIDASFPAWHWAAWISLPVCVLLCEAALQTGAVFLKKRMETAEKTFEGKMPVVAKMTDIRFRQVVRPGDTVEITDVLEDAYANAFQLGREDSAIEELPV